MLNREKDKIMGSLQETLDKESTKMEQLHKQDLENKERIHGENHDSLKVQLSKETNTLEAQLE